MGRMQNLRETKDRQTQPMRESLKKWRSAPTPSVDYSVYEISVDPVDEFQRDFAHSAEEGSLQPSVLRHRPAIKTSDS
jgi:hypothetical protein